MSVISSLSLSLAGCGHETQPASPVTLALVDRGWFNKEFRDLRERQYQDFSAETGIRVKLLPGPESAVEQVRLWRKLLGDGAEKLPVYPDVFGIDVIWAGILGKDLVDLQPHMTDGVPAYFPELTSNWRVNGRTIAMPNALDIGLLYYRTDLLRRYGYRSPPGTWADLERMAARIQSGERARGNKNFWGFVWEGAVSESLTCNALEWQASEGGGSIIGPNGEVTINNPSARKSWERASRWVGAISPPGVTTYKEQDAMNLWLSGNAAFMRNWSAAYVISGSDSSPLKSNFNVTLLPKGKAGRAEVLGGDGYGVSLRSRHQKEAIALVRYLCRRDTQDFQSRVLHTPPTIADLYQDSALLKSTPYFRDIKEAVVAGLVARPSTVTKGAYLEVSEAFSEAVHSVLVRHVSGSVAAARLEDQLKQITSVNRLSQRITSSGNKRASLVAH